MFPRPQYTDLTTMGGTGPFGPMSIIFGLYRRYQILWTDIAHLQYRPANRSLFTKFGVRSSLRSDAIVIATCAGTDGRTEGETDIAQMS